MAANRASRRAAASSRPSRGRRRSNVVTVDMKGVEGRIKVLDGEYLAKVVEVTQEEGQVAPYLKWKFQIAEGEDCAGGILYNNTSLSKQSLWNLRTLLEALDVEVPDSELDIDLDDLVDRELMIAVENETYEGKKQPRLVDFWQAEEPAAPKTTARAGKRDAERSTDRRSGGRSEREERPTSRTSSSTSTKTSRSKDEPPPLTQDEINDMSQEELEDLVKEEKLDVDVAKLKTLRRMRAAVIDAAEKEGILES